MAATFYPESMELREGREPDIDFAGKFMASYAPGEITTKSAALEHKLAPDRIYDAVLRNASTPSRTGDAPPWSGSRSARRSSEGISTCRRCTGSTP